MNLLDNPVLSDRILPEENAADAMEFICAGYVAAMRVSRPEFSLPAWGLIVSCLGDVDPDETLSQAAMRNLDLELAMDLGLSQDDALAVIHQLAGIEALERLAVLDVVRQFWAHEVEADNASDIEADLSKILAR